MTCKQKRFLTTIFFCLYTTFSVSTIYAVEDYSNGIKYLSRLSLEELMNLKITTATKNEQIINDAPSSVTIFSRKELINMGVTSLEQVMNYVPGFQATRESAIGDGYMIAGRGQATPQSSYNILYLINGQRLNSELAGGALEFNRFIAVSNIKQVEIIRGTGSALYGSNAYVGVVNIITNTDINQVYVDAGSMAHKELNINASTLIENLKLSVFAQHFSDSGQKYNAQYTYLVNPNRDHVEDPRGGNDLLLQLDWNNKLKVDLRHSKRTEESFFSIRGDAFPTDEFEQSQNNIFVNYHAIQQKNFKLNVNLGYSTGSHFQIIELLDGEQSYLETHNPKEKSLSAEINIHYNPSLNHKLLFGVERRRSYGVKVQRFNNRADPTGPLFPILYTIPVSDNNNVGLYVQDQWQISPRLAITSGFRFDESSYFDSRISPRAALVFKPESDSTFKFIYGEAFRPPSIRQVRSSTVGNDALKPETVKTLELAWLKNFSNLYTSFTYFNSRYYDKISTTPRSTAALPPAGPNIYSNLGDIGASGLEAELIAEIGNLSLRSSFTILKSDEKPHYFAKKSFSFIANYFYEQWNFNINGIFHDEMQQSGIVPEAGIQTVTLDSYWVWNSTVRYEHKKGVTIVGRFANLFDNDYTSPTRIRDFYNGLPNRGFSSSIGLEIRF